MWSFILDNQETFESLESFLVPTSKVEQYAGIFLWEKLIGSKMKKERDKVRKMWDLG